MNKIVVLIALIASGCSDSTASGGIMIQEMPSPGGAHCYVIMQDGKAVGGNCL